MSFDDGVGGATEDASKSVADERGYFHCHHCKSQKTHRLSIYRI